MLPLKSDFQISLGLLTVMTVLFTLLYISVRNGSHPTAIYGAQGTEVIYGSCTAAVCAMITPSGGCAED